MQSRNGKLQSGINQFLKTDIQTIHGREQEHMIYDTNCIYKAGKIIQEIHGGWVVSLRGLNNL